MSDLATRRKAIEDELKSKSESIADSVGRIRKDLSLPGVLSLAVVKKHPVESTIGLAAAGLIIGLWATRRSKSKPPVARSKDLNPDVAVFLAAVQAAQSAGLTDEEAIRHAVTKSSVTSQSKPGLGEAIKSRVVNQLAGMAEILVRTTVSIIAREAATWLSESLSKAKKTSSQ